MGREISDGIPMVDIPTGRKEGGLGCLECSLFKNCRPGLVVHPLEGVVPVAGAERNSLGIFSLRWWANGS